MTDRVRYMKLLFCLHLVCPFFLYRVIKLGHFDESVPHRLISKTEIFVSLVFLMVSGLIVG